MWTLVFWKAVGERVIFTMIEVLIPMIAATRLDLVDWPTTGWIVLTAGALALLKGVLAARVGNPGPSLTTETLVQP
jgi:hypothetical protein